MIDTQIRQETWPEYLPSPVVLVSIVVVLAAWQLLSSTMPAYRFPGLGHLARGTWLAVSGGTQYDPGTHYGITLLRIVLGFTIVMVLGSVIGVAMGVNDVFEDYISTFTVVLLTVPSVIWAFLAVLWFGLRDVLVPVFVIVIIILPYVAVTMWQGTKDVETELLEMATAFKIDSPDVWRHIYVPHLTPYTYATARLAFAISWKLSLVAEIFGSTKGVGVVVHEYYAAFQTDMIIAWALPVMFLMLGVERVFQYMEKRSYRWKGDTDVDTADIEGEAI